MSLKNKAKDNFFLHSLNTTIFTKLGRGNPSILTTSKIKDKKLAIGVEKAGIGMDRQYNFFLFRWN